MKKITAYKVFNPDWTCRGFQYEVGKTYTHEGEINLCNAGFHACKKVADCFNYYSFDSKNKVAIVELSGDVRGDGDKSVSSVIKIVEELSWNDMLELANTGNGNSGHRNSGNRNSGHRNSGDNNSGNSNSGDNNSGDNNSGDRNSGNRNSGHRNSGDRNSGDRNSGDRNSGNNNSGHRNPGDNNSGHRNSGNWNSGHRNSGDRNSGDNNSGNRNSGNRNSGNWNSGNRNSGFFNSITPNIIHVFNKECSRKEWDKTIKPIFIYEINTTEWIPWSKMNDNEKGDNKNAYLTEGYLKTYSYKEAWKKAYNNASKDDIRLLKALPNFDAKVFEEITGIKVK